MNAVRILLVIFCFSWVATNAQESLVLEDIFELQYISDPQISPNGKQILYVRNSMDIYTDGIKNQIWMINTDGTNNHPVTSNTFNCNTPRWSPDGSRILYLSNEEKGTQLYLRFINNGAEQRLSNFPERPYNFSWSPDGKFIVFNRRLESSAPPFVKTPSPPKDAKWATAPKYITKTQYKSDGAGFLNEAYAHIFIMSIDGGYARQLTEGNEDYSGPFSWSADGTSIYFSSNMHENRDFDPRNSEIFGLEITTKNVTQITTRLGPDDNPVVSPDGKWIAYLGNDENLMGYQVTHLYLMDKEGKNIQQISKGFDRDVTQIQWQEDSKGLFFSYDSEGKTRIASMDLNGKVIDFTDQAGGLSLGRPYAGSSYTMAKNGMLAFTLVGADHPAELAVLEPGTKKIKRLTHLNQALFDHKKLGEIEEIWYPSSFDGKRIQGWICKPPGFDPQKKYPLILEIHGGPFLNYGPRFAIEIQLFAAAGYVVLYTNPRGSTSYGSEFANEIHHNYPSQDYDDLISGVDAIIAKGYIDTENLFVTGGSGGGVLTAWIVGKTDRFKAAVVAKPVINWTSHVLHADGIGYFAKYWFGKYPWEDYESYWKRSPLSLVGNVTTPTMLLTGEQDYRTPMSESEQYYAALKLNKVETALVRIQDAGHGIGNRPSNLINKVAYILGWFHHYKTDEAKN